MGTYYLKSPVVFYAFNFTEEASKNIDSWPSWARAANAMGRLAFTDERDSGWAIKGKPKAEREHVVFGDWIVLGEAGELFLVPNETFLSRYELAGRVNRTRGSVLCLTEILGDAQWENYGVTAQEIGEMQYALTGVGGGSSEWRAHILDVFARFNAAIVKDGGEAWDIDFTASPFAVAAV